jgi:hypothetical protein
MWGAPLFAQDIPMIDLGELNFGGFIYNLFWINNRPDAPPLGKDNLIAAIAADHNYIKLDRKISKMSVVTDLSQAIGMSDNLKTAIRSRGANYALSRYVTKQKGRNIEGLITWYIYEESLDLWMYYVVHIKGRL